MSQPTLIAPPYSGPAATCRQCGNAGATTTWTPLEGLGPALRRACDRCTYQWTERCPNGHQQTVGFQT